MFKAKTWRDRVSEFPRRRILTDVNSGDTQTVLVERAEGAVSTEGDAWNAANMNDLEERISDAFTSYTEVRLSSGSWSGSAAPFSQTVENVAITAESKPILYSLVNGLTAAQQAEYIKAYARVSQGYAVTNDGSVTFYVYKKPATSITVGLRGV